MDDSLEIVAGRMRNKPSLINLCVALISGGILLVISFFATAPSTAQEANPPSREIARLIGQDLAESQSALATLLESRDQRVGRFLQAYSAGELYRWNDQVVTVDVTQPQADAADGANEADTVEILDPLSRTPISRGGKSVRVARSDLGISLSPPRRLRRALQNAAHAFDLQTAGRGKRLIAATKLGDSGNPTFIPYLEAARKTEEDAKIAYTLRESISIIHLRNPQSDLAVRQAAARDLGELSSPRGLPVLVDRVEDLDSSEAPSSAETLAVRKTYEQAIRDIESYQQIVRFLQYVFSGVSLGSILVLMALGLAIIFGQMGVINMAHGEMMMIGAYATFWVHELFIERLPESAFSWYFVAALPVAFLAAAAVGVITELLVVRHLYGRPLETLLATWGVSLVLIQSIRLLHGDNVALNNPTWLRGGSEVIQDFVLPFNRCFVIGLCVVALVSVRGLMNYTKFGLRVRATVQNRDTAESLGVRTRRVDAMTFAIGAGLAGIAGYALTLIGGITPDMGQNYIVDSFLVVVTGGVGELAGTVGAGLGLGVLNKFLEPWTGAVWGKVLILVVVVVFIQFRPAGLFPPKGRVADA